MAQRIRYLTHPQVTQDPNCPVPEWSLSALGAERVLHLLESDALGGTTRIFSSDETKALETAGPLAAGLGIFVTVRRAMHENDRSATGYLEPQAFEDTANALFAHPTQSTLGWETAADAQARIVAAIKEAVSEEDQGDILCVGHGAVGTLLYCAFGGVAIDRKYDQPRGGGNYITLQPGNLKPLHHWRPMETLYQGA